MERLSRYKSSNTANTIISLQWRETAGGAWEKDKCYLRREGGFTASFVCQLAEYPRKRCWWIYVELGVMLDQRAEGLISLQLWMWIKWSHHVAILHCGSQQLSLEVQRQIYFVGSVLIYVTTMWMCAGQQLTLKDKFNPKNENTVRVYSPSCW